MPATTSVKYLRDSFQGGRIRVLAASVALGLMAACSSHAAREPILLQEDLFRAGEAGYALYRIPGIVVTARGSVLVYAEARKGGAGDWGEIDLVLRRGADGGREWGPVVHLPKVDGPVAKNPAAVAKKLGKPGEITYNNPVAVADRAGAVHFLFCVEYARCFYMRSDDDGRTFSKPVEVTGVFEEFRREYDWKVIATGPGHGIELRTGRLVVPVWLSTGTGGHAHRPSAVSVIVSDDAGATWRRGALAAVHSAELANPGETCAAELSDGRVMLNVRHETPSRGRAVVLGPDGAGGWAKPAFDDALFEPVCMAGLVRVPGGALVFSNPDSGSRERRNLTVRLSEDDGRTWRVKRVLEPGPSAYSDLAAAPGGGVLCFYERGSEAGKPYGSLRLARISLDWLRRR